MRTLLLFIGLVILTTAVHAQSKQVKGPERTWVIDQRHRRRRPFAYRRSTTDAP